MKAKYRKLLVMFMALMLVVILVCNNFSGVVNAALTGSQNIGVIFAYGGNHGDITLQGGWHKGASNNRFAVWYTKQDRRVMYCLEPGNPRSNDSEAVSKDVNYIRNNLSNRFLSGTQIEQFIGYILAYGYTGTIDGGQDIRYFGPFPNPITESGGSDTTQMYEACQILIWETVVGERDANFNYVAPDSGYTPCKAIHTTSGETGSVFETYYQSIANSVKQYGSIPAFMAPTLRNSFDMDGISKSEDGYYYFDNVGNTDINDWSFIVVDSNGQKINGCSAAVKNRRVRVSVPDSVSEAYLYGYNRICGDGVVAWSSDGVWGAGSTSQDLVQTGFADPVHGYAKIKEASGAIAIHKESDYGVVSGIRFNLYYRGEATNVNPTENRINEYSVYTDSDGIAALEGIPYGWYEIEEIAPLYTRSVIEADRYDEVTNNPLFLVTEGQSEDFIVTANNYVDAVIRINKTDKVTGEAIGFTSFNLYLDVNDNGLIDEDEENTRITMRDDDGDAVIDFTGIGVGNYLIREAQTTGLYDLSDEIIRVKVDAPNLYEFSYENDAFGSVTITKVDADDHSETLSDAIFALYEDTNENGTLDSGVDVFVTNITDDDGDGIYFLNRLPRAHYLITEVYAPEEHEIDNRIYPFEVSLSNLNCVISNADDGTFENYSAIYGTLFMTSENSDLRVVEYGTDITLGDNIMYRHLIPGESYIVNLTLVDGDTGEVITDEDGNRLSVNHEFVPETSEGIYVAEITIDSTRLSGRTIVAFERMYRAGHLVGSHEDINSYEQTLFVPEIGTYATAGVNASKVVTESEATPLVDTVNYSNLVPDREYVVVGIIMDKTTGDVFCNNVTNSSAEVVFTPEDNSGSVEVGFNINTINFAGDLVIFEELYDKETGTLVAIHKDINYLGQTIRIKARVTPTSTPTPGIPRTGESSDEIIKTTILGAVIVTVSIVILGKYYQGFRKEE